ncbi:MAG: glycoside hydrolase family 28 protein [Clostridia bacterium]|nr:glycoside hydrolase family 28 protein [Clostridia bacterium]
MFNLKFVSAVSACFEMANDKPYYSNQAYSVKLDGKTIYQDKTENVFSIYDLQPGRTYTVEIGGESVTFTTDFVSAVINVKDYNAKGDGIFDDTDSIQTAIDNCIDGGLIVIPCGKYNICPLRLKSKITLYLQNGATFIGQTNPKLYPILEGSVIDKDGNEKIISTWEGEIMKNYAPLIGGYDVFDVKIVGLGTIDGNAQNGPWWQDEYVRSREVARPRAVFLNNCNNVYFHGITVQNGASWNVHPFFSQNLGFYDVRINAPKRSPNTDGLNPEACDKVDIIGCVFSTGDDCIAIKAGTRQIAEKFKRSADNYTIRNCLMQDGHGAVVIGSEMSGGVKNLKVSQCVFKGTDRGLRIKTRRNRGKLAIVDGVEFSNICMRGVKTPLVINMFYICGPEGKEEYVWSRKAFPIDDGTPYIGKFIFKDIDCTDCEVCAGYFDGLPEQPIEEIVIENVNFIFNDNTIKRQPALTKDTPEVSRWGLYFNFVNKVVLRNVKVENVIGEKIQQYNCKKLEIIK